MEVEDFLEDDKTEMHDVVDSGQTVGHISDEGASSEKTQLESTEGLLVLPLLLLLLRLFYYYLFEQQFKADGYKLCFLHTVGIGNSVS